MTTSFGFFMAKRSNTGSFLPQAKSGGFPQKFFTRPRKGVYGLFVPSRELALSLLYCSATQAQSTWEVGGGLGGMIYKGDLAPSLIPGNVRPAGFLKIRGACFRRGLLKGFQKDVAFCHCSNDSSSIQLFRHS